MMFFLFRDGKLGGVPFVDLFHYILTVANIMFLQGKEVFFICY